MSRRQIGCLARDILFAASIFVYSAAHIPCWGSHLQVRFEEAQSLLIVCHGRIKTLCLHGKVPQQHKHICTPTTQYICQAAGVTGLVPVTTLPATCFYKYQSGVVLCHRVCSRSKACTPPCGTFKPPNTSHSRSLSRLVQCTQAPSWFHVVC